MNIASMPVFCMENVMLLYKHKQPAHHTQSPAYHLLIVISIQLLYSIVIIVYTFLSFPLANYTSYKLAPAQALFGVYL